LVAYDSSGLTELPPNMPLGEIIGRRVVVRVLTEAARAARERPPPALGSLHFLSHFSFFVGSKLQRPAKHTEWERRGHSRWLAETVELLEERLELGVVEFLLERGN